MQFNTLWRAPTGETGAVAASRAPRTRGAAVETLSAERPPWNSRCSSP